MSFADNNNPYRTPASAMVAYAQADERSDFIRRTYLHLAGAVLGLVAIEGILLNLPGVGNIARLMTTGWNWLLVIGAFMLVSFLAEKWAQSSASIGMQYLGLTLYVAAESVIMLPLLYIAREFDLASGQNTIATAAVVTLTVFGGLTAFVWITRTDFSFLRSVLMIAGFAALGMVVCSMIFGFSLGILFSGAMILFASGYILYQTSNVMLHYQVGQHVAASLALFASVATLFWYILRLVMALSSRD